MALIQFLEQNQLQSLSLISLACNYKLPGFILSSPSECLVLCRCPANPGLCLQGFYNSEVDLTCFFLAPPACKDRGCSKPCAGVKVSKRAEDQHPSWGSLGRKSQSLQDLIPKIKISPTITCFLLQSLLLKLRALILSLRRPPSD